MIWNNLSEVYWGKSFSIWCCWNLPSFLEISCNSESGVQLILAAVALPREENLVIQLVDIVDKMDWITWMFRLRLKGFPCESFCASCACLCYFSYFTGFFTLLLSAFPLLTHGQ